MIRTVKETIQDYQSQYRFMAPDNASIDRAQSLWEAWEKSGIEAPNVQQIADTSLQWEIGFFKDLVTITEWMEGKELNIQYCAFCLDKYNFYAVSAKDGYVVLVDDYFFQFLYILITVLIFHAQGLVEPHEEAELRILVRKMILNNYFKRRRFNFAEDNIAQRLLVRDYEIAEFANYFFHSLKIFILSHEIGHHVLGHTKGTMTKTMVSSTKKATIEVDRREIIDEFEADNYGYRLFDKVSNTIDERIVHAFCQFKFDFAPLFLFDLFERLDEMSEVLTGQKNSYTTHPPPIKRQSSLQRAFDIPIDDPLHAELKKSLEMVSL